MAGIYSFARSLVGAGEKLETILAGSGGWKKGDPLVADGTGGFVKKTGGTDTVVVKYVAAADCDAAAYGVAYPAISTNVFRATKSGTPVAGVKYGMKATTLLPDSTNTTQTMLQCIQVDEADSTIVEVVFTGWIA